MIKLVENVKDRVEVNMGRLEREGMQMEVFSDSFLWNVGGGKSQIRYIIGLRDENGRNTLCLES